jgi:N-terminal acetyltransferase B complex non-catalytic subunit
LKLRYLFTLANLQDRSESSEKQDAVSSTIEAFDALSISDRPETAEERVAILQSFIKDTLATYNAAVSLGPTELPTDNHCGDDSAILAAMAWVRLYHLSPTTYKSSLLKAITVLEDALSRSVHDYQILLILTRLYLLLGAPTTAYKLYKRLSIKQIQNDTMSHYYFSRISSLHPGDSEISRELGTISKLYHNIQRQIPDMLVGAYEQSSYGQLEGYVQLGDRLRLSYWSSISRLERLRTIRFRNEPKVDQPKAPGVEWDNRDFGIIHNFELSSQPSFEARFLRTGPLQGKGWINVFELLEDVSDALESKDGKLDVTVSEKIFALVQETAVSSELTKAEKKHITATAVIASILAEPTEDAVNKLISQLEEITKRGDSAAGLPWEQLHENVIELQTLTFVKLLVENKAFKGAKALKKQQTDLKQAASAAAKVVKERLQNKDVKFIDDETIKGALEAWPGESVEGVKKLAQDLRQAQREAGRFGVNGWKKGF